MAVLLSGSSVLAAQVIFHQAEKGNPDIEERLISACRFYGADLKKNFADIHISGLSEAPVTVVIEASCRDTLTPDDIPAAGNAVQDFLILSSSSGNEERELYDRLTLYSGDSSAQ